MSTGLLVIDPYNDFLAAEGKIWPYVREVAERLRAAPNMRDLVADRDQCAVVRPRDLADGRDRPPLRTKRSLIMLTRFLALLFVLLAASADASDFIGADILIPAAGRTPGALDSRWQTDLLVTNTSRAPIVEPVVIVFRRDGVPDQAFSADIAPRATLVLRDVIRDTFGHETAVGILRVLASSTSAALSARARIYNVGSAQGQFGQIVHGVATAKLPREAYLSGLSGAGANRTNVGIVNAGSAEAQVFLTLWDRDGVMLRGIFAALPPHGSIVLNDLFAHFGTGLLDDATLHVVASERFYAYASIVRADSGDADFVTAAGADR